MLENLIGPESIILELQSESKDELFSEMVENLVRRNGNFDRGTIISAIEEREERKNTCIMPGVAVPHASVPSLKKSEVVLGISRAGIDYELDVALSSNKENFVHLVFMFLFDPDNTQDHLDLLADCAMLLANPAFYADIMKAKDVHEVCSIIKEIEYGET